MGACQLYGGARSGTGYGHVRECTVSAMILISSLPLLLALVGVLLYALSSNPKVTEIGRLMFACGLLVSLYAVAGHTAKLFG